MEAGDKAIMTGVVRILVDPVMQLRRSGEGRAPEPEQQHKPDSSQRTHPRRAACCKSSSLHAEDIEGPNVPRQARFRDRREFTPRPEREEEQASVLEPLLLILPNQQD